MEKKHERTFGFLDSNVFLKRSTARGNRRSSSEAQGQENSAKRPKLDPEGAIKHGVNAGVLPKVLELTSEYIPVKEQPIVERKEDGENFVIKDPWLTTSDQLKDVYNMEIELEYRARLSNKYCSDSCAVDPVRRELLLEELMQLQCAVRVGSEVFHLAVTLMDLYLDSSDIEESEVQDAATSAFWLSYKFYHGRIEVKSFLKHCTITKPTLLRYERLIFQHVDFNLQFTNSMSLIHYHMYLIFDGVIPRTLYYCVCYLVDLMFYHIEFIRETYHSRAVTGLFTTLYLFESPLRTEVWAGLDSNTKEVVQRTHHRLLILLKKIQANEPFRRKSVLYKRYATSKFKKICKHSALNSDLKI